MCVCVSVCLSVYTSFFFLFLVVAVNFCRMVISSTAGDSFLNPIIISADQVNQNITMKMGDFLDSHTPPTTCLKARTCRWADLEIDLSEL